MLGDELVVCRLSLPRVEAGFKASLESVLIYNHEIITIVVRVPYYAIDDIFDLGLQYQICPSDDGIGSNDVPAAGRNRFSTVAGLVGIWRAWMGFS